MSSDPAIGIASERASTAAGPEVPAIITAAGEDAVQRYRAFFHQDCLGSNTSQVYGSIIRRFFRWAEQRGLALETICSSDAAAFCDEVCRGSTANYLSAIRSLFRYLATTGVITTNPLETRRARRIGPDEEQKRTPRIPLAELKRSVLEIGEADGWQDGDEDVQAGLVLLAEFSIDTRDPRAISRFTGVPLRLVREFSARLIANGIWRPDGKIASEWDDPENGAMAFMLDVWVALGLLERGSADEGNAAQNLISPVPAASREESDGK